MPKYRITGGPDGSAGLDYKAKRVEQDDIVDDLPRESIKWLREQGYIEPVGKTDADETDESPSDIPSDVVDVATDPVED